MVASTPSDQELDSLVDQLTLEEKISLLSGRNFWETVCIKRLGIPSIKVTDGPNGARGEGFVGAKTSACFPASVSLAATFNNELARQIGVALAEETHTKNAHVLLGPTTCLHRSPLGGRNFESFSEDPFLSGELATEYVLGLQSKHIGATIKHFVANEQETRRFTVDTIVSERALRELYLRPFEMVVKNAGPWAVMTCYNKVNGRYTDDQSTFIQDILRSQWGFKGLIMTDWGSASEAVGAGIKYGLDLEMPGPPVRRTPEAVKNSLDAGEIRVQDIDARVLEVLKFIRRTGKFTDARDEVEERAESNPAHERLIRAAGAEGIVLLKNSSQTLPLRKEMKKIAIIGPLAKEAAAHGGGSASVSSHYKTTPFDALSKRLEGVELKYSKGAHIYRGYPYMADSITNRSGGHGFMAEYYETSDFSGNPFHTEDVPIGMFLSATSPHLAQAKAGRFTTTFTPQQSGRHCLSFAGLGPAKLFINDELVGRVDPAMDSMAFFFGAEAGTKLRHEFTAGEPYRLRLETVVSPVFNSDLAIFRDKLGANLGFASAQEIDADLLGEASGLAKDADVAVVFVGNTPNWESEGFDMQSMSLPADGSQDRLVSAVCEANPNTIVVVSTGAAVDLPWLDQASAVLQTFYGGQEIGNAIVDVLVGDVNPSGRLPFSWPRRYEDVACYGNFGADSQQSRRVEYTEGINVGYRHFDRLYNTEKEALFAFGHGLSYTKFEVFSNGMSGVLDGSPEAEVVVDVAVHNVGDRSGAQTVQVYLAPPGGARDRPLKTLVAFGKCFLEPGKRQDLSLSFKREAAVYWDEALEEWTADSGTHEVLIALSSNPKDVVARHSLELKAGYSYKA